MAFDEEDTIELDLTAGFEDAIVADLVEELGIQIAAATHQGRVRTKNEDQYAVVRRTRKGEVLATSLGSQVLEAGEAQHSWLLVVADGVGGNVSGEIASATAIQVILDLGPRLRSWIMQPTIRPQDDHADRIELYADAIQQELQQQAKTNPGLAGMATTITAAYIFGSEAIVVNVGDSRSYLVREKSIHQITRDHTIARELEDAGAPKQMVSRYQHVLTRCFNTQSESVTFDVFQLKLIPHDRILLCSDGLSDMVADEEILQIISADSPIKETCEQLVTRALANGGRDNVTVVLARV